MTWHAVRYNGDIISVWNKSAENTEAANRISEKIRGLWQMPPYVAVDYKPHNASLFNNKPNVWRR